MDNMIKEKDIFDKIMKLPFLRIFGPFYTKHKEILLYLFFGALTMGVSIASYAILDMMLEFNALIANVISWILAVLFAFFTNRIWVFRTLNNTTGDLIRQLFSFCSGRIVTLIIEEAILFVFVTCLRCNGISVKVVAQVIVVILNYIISKLWVFKN